MDNGMSGGFPAGQFFLGRDGKVFGPFSREQIDALRASGEIMQYHWLWDGSGNWVAANLPPPPPVASPAAATSPVLAAPAATVPGPAAVTSPMLTTPAATAPGPAPRAYDCDNEVTEDISFPDVRGMLSKLKGSTFDISESVPPATTEAVPSAFENNPTVSGVSLALGPIKEDPIFTTGEVSSAGVALDLSQSGAPVPPPMRSQAPQPQTSSSAPLFSRQSPGQGGAKKSPPHHPEKTAHRQPKSQMPERGNLNAPSSASVSGRDLSAIRAVCYDRHRVINGTLARASGEGCVFTLRLSVHPQKSTFVPGRSLWLNLIDEVSGRSENVRAVLTSGKRQDGNLELKLSWDRLPTLLSAQAQGAYGS